MIDKRVAITYRPARASDTAAIKALIRLVNINPMGLKWQRFMVAIQENGRLIGCGQIKRHRDGTRELASIAVQKAWRRQGIANTIIQRLLAEQQPPVWLTCMDRLVPFYARLSFAEVTDGRQMPAYFRYARRFFTIYQRFIRLPGYLAVMRWPVENQIQ